ncbi:hypothetical protein Tco_0556882 [Tanacetum coccineum]
MRHAIILEASLSEPRIATVPRIPAQYLGNICLFAAPTDSSLLNDNANHWLEIQQLYYTRSTYHCMPRVLPDDSLLVRVSRANYRTSRAANRTCNLVPKPETLYQSLEDHVSPPEWCHVTCQLLSAPSPEPPPDHRSTVVSGGGGQRRSTVADHRGPPSDHYRTTGQRWLTASQRSGQQWVWLPRGMPRGSTCQPHVPTWHPRGC